MKYLKEIMISVSFLIPIVMPTYADDVKRPGANNKSSITKKNDTGSGKSFFKKLIDSDDVSNERVMEQIRMLSDLRHDGILTEDEFAQKKTYLLNKIK